MGSYHSLLPLQKQAETQPLSHNAKKRHRNEKRKKPEWIAHKFNYLAPNPRKEWLVKFLFDLLSWKPTVGLVGVLPEQAT